eukprot:CAMPEP_0184695324 /NCGR_PEP_ID=MMETSP0313-20130426/2996_1 /TAXON_ID=2792 /ORGANISM="Porphyridium aerugineum, Strain SAG 1380-2" /LENGTH=221 /DNA_ID=CAMNT_0027153759 /DNA_START=210 /DNA_END=875 /DNA_ORIENTATION=+
MSRNLSAYVVSVPVVRRQAQLATCASSRFIGAARRMSPMAASLSRPSRLVMTVSSSSPERVSSRTATIVKEQPQAAGDEWNVKLLYDSACSLCMKEVNFLMRRDVNNKIKFVDIHAADYKPEENCNVTYESAMKRIHAILPDGTVITGVQVFRKTYDAIGLSWVYAVTEIPFVGKIADKLYDVWADNRLRITGRAELAELVREREERLKDVSCDDECSVDW